MTIATNEKNKIAGMEKLKLINRNKMRYISFSAFSDTYLDSEEETKDLLIGHLRNSTEPFVTMDLFFKVKFA